MLKLMKVFLLALPAVFCTANGDVFWITTSCRYSSVDLRDIEYIQAHIYNKFTIVQYNSTLEKFVGYTELGIYNAERLNNDTAALQGQKSNLNGFCKKNAAIHNEYIFQQSGEPQVKVQSVKNAEGGRPAVVICSAYNFFPRNIKVTWLRNGKKVKGGQTSIEELADGDWYYQVHSHLEYTPESGEEISCVVEHASFKKPMEYKWDPSMSKVERSKIVIGVSGLVFGIVLSVAGFIYYKKKSSGRILVSTLTPS